MSFTSNRTEEKMVQVTGESTGNSPGPSLKRSDREKSEHSLSDVIEIEVRIFPDPLFDKRPSDFPITIRNKGSSKTTEYDNKLSKANHLFAP